LFPSTGPNQISFATGLLSADCADYIFGTASSE
jgi:hypothetical protein